MIRNNLADKAFTFTREIALFTAPCHILVGVSGGADSMALLHTLLHWPEEGLQVSAVHIHHGLRGETADRDEKLVRDYCEQNGVPLTVYHEDVAGYAAQTGTTIEEAGRWIRYARFEETCDAIGAQVIATAHTSSDQVETVLMRITRGCGIDGLTGIPARRGRICRPLLSCTRADVEAYCAANAIPFVIDETNEDLSFTRNRIRHELLPLLRSINPSADKALLRLHDHASADSAVLQERAQIALNQAAYDYGYDIQAFLNETEPIRRRMIRSMMQAKAISSITEPHILAAEQVLLSGRGEVLLPDGFVFSVSQGVVSIRIGTACPAFEPIVVDALPFAFDLDGRRFQLSLVEREAENVHNLFFNTAIDYDTIQGDLYLRCRCEGDVLHPAGRGIGKTLKKLMNEWHIPTHLRDGYPLLCDAAGVILVPGYAVDERVRVTDATKHLLVWDRDVEQG